MTTATSPSGGALDGRTKRRLDNRTRILDAALDLVAEAGELEFETIAQRAGVSVRSVYNHFPTARHLVAGMYERGTDRVLPYVEQLPSRDLPFDERVRTWVRLWGRIQEEIAPIRWRALIAEDEHPELQPELAELRKRHRAEIKRAFPEIDGKHTMSAALAATDSLMWRVLRRHQSLSVEQACNVVEENLRRLAT
jgi:AcrR family transcriptional regulator